MEQVELDRLGAALLVVQVEVAGSEPFIFRMVALAILDKPVPKVQADRPLVSTWEPTHLAATVVAATQPPVLAVTVQPVAVVVAVEDQLRLTLLALVAANHSATANRS